MYVFWPFQQTCKWTARTIQRMSIHSLFPSRQFTVYQRRPSQVHFGTPILASLCQAFGQVNYSLPCRMIRRYLFSSRSLMYLHMRWCVDTCGYILSTVKRLVRAVLGPAQCWPFLGCPLLGGARQTLLWNVSLHRSQISVCTMKCWIF